MLVRLGVRLENLKKSDLQGFNRRFRIDFFFFNCIQTRPSVYDIICLTATQRVEHVSPQSPTFIAYIHWNSQHPATH